MSGRGKSSKRRSAQHLTDVLDMRFLLLEDYLHRKLGNPWIRNLPGTECSER